MGEIQNIPLKISTLSEELYFQIALQVVVYVVKRLRINSIIATHMFSTNKDVVQKDKIY